MANLALKNATILNSLKLTDRVTLTSTDSDQQVATMTVGNFIDQLEALRPIYWRGMKGSVAAGGSIKLDQMSGLLVLQVVSLASIPSIYVVSSRQQTITLIGGYDYATKYNVSFSFDEDNNLYFNNQTAYICNFTCSYQKVGSLQK